MKDNSQRLLASLVVLFPIVMIFRLWHQECAATAVISVAGWEVGAWIYSSLARRNGGR